MSDKSPIYDDGSNDDSMLDSCTAAGSAVLELEGEVGTASEEWTGARCEKCEAPMASDIVSICRRCGWYGSLGQFVEVDPDWEAASEPATSKVEAAPRPSHLQVWLSLMPRWSWVIIASVFALLVESIIVRLVTPADSWIRTTWSLGQLSIGIVAALGCHAFNFIVLAANDSEIGLLDLMLKPLRLWGRAIQNLPLRLWVANAAACGLAAALFSVLVIGGIPYERMWDWGFEQPPKQDLMGAVMDQVQKVDGEGSDDLEQSINDFAGKGGESDDKPKEEPPKPKQKADCVIIGYKLDREGRIATLVVGTANSGQLIHAGNVTPKLANDEMNSLLNSLKAIERPNSIIQVDYEATWVHPKYTCRVAFGERTKSGRLRDIEWSNLLGAIDKKR